MFTKFFKFFLILFLYQGPLYSKNETLKDFNSKDLSNYFSGIVAYENGENSKALKFFKSSKPLINRHNSYLERYVYSLVQDGEVKEAIIQIKNNITKDNSNSFELNLIMAIDSLKKKNYKKTKDYLKASSKFINNNRLNLILIETLKQYLYTFEEKKIPVTKKNFGNFSFINETFQRCYLNDENTEVYFNQMISAQNEANYSRYIFFYMNYLLENSRYQDALRVSNKLDYLNSSLLISQGKKWVEEKKLANFKKIFSCKSQDDVISELFFLISNLYASQEDYEKSNFYLNISNFLNPDFYFNLSLLVENYFQKKNYKKTIKILKTFNEKDEFYYWFRLKKESQIISKKNNNEGKALDFINLKFKKIEDASLKMIFDIANFNKNAKQFSEAIKYYNQILLKIDIDSELYAEILYRRGGCYERLGDYKNSDKDLLKALKINPDDAYVLNYLAYSWLERDYKIDVALKMLKKAYKDKSNDPYIIDSIGWAHYLIKEYEKAEKFLKRAVELMPNDPVVNDHYGDILWKLERKIQARYFWESVLKFDETEKDIKKKVRDKLIYGLKNYSL